MLLNKPQKTTCQKTYSLLTIILDQHQYNTIDCVIIVYVCENFNKLA